MTKENNREKTKKNEIVVRVEIVICPCTDCDHTHCVAEGSKYCTKNSNNEED